MGQTAKKWKTPILNYTIVFISSYRKRFEPVLLAFGHNRNRSSRAPVITDSKSSVIVDIATLRRREVYILRLNCRLLAPFTALSHRISILLSGVYCFSFTTPLFLLNTKIELSHCHILSINIFRENKPVCGRVMPSLCILLIFTLPTKMIINCTIPVILIDRSSPLHNLNCSHNFN